MRKELSIQLSTLFFFVSLLTTIFTSGEGGGQAYQILSVIFIVMAACLTLVHGFPTKHTLSFVEWLFIFSTIYSLIISLIVNETYSVIYSLIMFFVFISLVILIRALTLNEIISSVAMALGVGILINLALEYNELINALSVTLTETGLVRYSPFGMHPNLVGLIYGMSCIFFTGLGFCNTGMKRMFFLFFASTSAIFVLAASSRASLLGLFISLVLVLLKSVNIRLLLRREIVISLLLTPLLIMIFFDKIYGWLSGILEFDSDTRGVNAGATGRTEIWEAGINLFWDDTVRFLWGKGYRSVWGIGFPTENSYITILLELGILCGGAIILTVLYIMIRSYFNIERSTNFYKSKLVYFTALLIFITSQSFFNRYLLGIGNITSLVVLILLFSWKKHVP